MRKMLLPFLPLLLLVSPSSAQSPGSPFYFRIGATGFATWVRDQPPFLMLTLTAAPGLLLAQGSDMSLGFTLPVSVGAAFKRIDDSYLGLDIPLMFELHFGSGTGRNRKAKIGLMLGAGAGYTLTTRYVYDETRSIDFWGLRLQTGISLRGDESGDHLLFIPSFGKSFTGRSKYTMSIGVCYVLGRLRPRQQSNFSE